MRIAFYEIHGWEKAYFKNILKGHDLEFHKESLTEENASLAKDSDAVSVFIYSKIGKEVLEKMPKLKMITTRSTGFDHIDIAMCKDRKIAVSNVPFYGENTVAEHTFALILSLSRNLRKAYLNIQRQEYSIEGLKGFDLKCKTLGVIGAGHIGLHVIRIAKGFGMKVLAFDTKPDCFLSEVLGFEYAPFDYVLGNSDIITLHAPDNEHTHHMLNRESMKKIKKGAIIINTSRGGLIETEALIEALDGKRISGAGLDVLEGEDLIKEEKQLLYDPSKAQALGDLVKDHILLSRDNVIYTPHIAFYSQEALERVLKETAENIEGYAAGRPKNLVT